MQTSPVSLGLPPSGIRETKAGTRERGNSPIGGWEARGSLKPSAQPGKADDPRLIHQLVALQAMPPLVRPITAQTPTPSRLKRKRPQPLEIPGSDSKGLCKSYQPQPAKLPHVGGEDPLMMELQVRLGQRHDAHFVKQSEGTASAKDDLLMTNLMQCGALFVRDKESGSTLVMHHDSGLRSSTPNEDGPVSPATPTRGLIGRDRFGYEEFMKKPGPKRVLLVDSERGYDRREVLHQIAARGAHVEVLQPLTLRTARWGAPDDDAQWHMTYRPASDELFVHLEEQAGEKAMRFSGLLTGEGPPMTRGQDMADNLPGYRQRIEQRRDAANAPTRLILDLCLYLMEERNSRHMQGSYALTGLCAALDGVQGVPAGIQAQLRQLTPLRKELTQVITRLVDHCLEHGVQSPDTTPEPDTEELDAFSELAQELQGKPDSILQLERGTSSRKRQR